MAHMNGVVHIMELPDSIKKTPQIAEFSVFTQKQSKFITPVDAATLSIIAEGDPDLTTYLKKLLRTNKPEQ